MTKSARPEGSSKPTGSHGLKLLMVLGIVILGCIAGRSALALGLFLASSIRAGTGWTGDFWSNEFPIIVLVAIIGIGSFGIYQLVRILRR